MKSKQYKIGNMHCDSCAKMIELDLEDVGINASCSFSKGILDVKNDHDSDKVMEIVKKAGYTVQHE